MRCAALAVKTCVALGTACLLAGLAGCTLSSRGHQDGPSVPLTEHVAPSLFVAVVPGPALPTNATGQVLSGVMAASARPGEDVEILRAGTKPAVLVAADSPPPATVTIPGKPTAPNAGVTVLPVSVSSAESRCGRSPRRTRSFPLEALPAAMEARRRPTASNASSSSRPEQFPGDAPHRSAMSYHASSLSSAKTRTLRPPTIRPSNVCVTWMRDMPSCSTPTRLKPVQVSGANLTPSSTGCAVSYAAGAGRLRTRPSCSGAPCLSPFLGSRPSDLRMARPQPPARPPPRW